MSVQVEAAAKADAGVQAWVKELRAALEARKDEFRLAKPGETPELVVRIDSVGKGQNDPPVMNGAFLIGKTTHPFNLGFTDVQGPGRGAGPQPAQVRGPDEDGPRRPLSRPPSRDRTTRSPR